MLVDAISSAISTAKTDDDEPRVAMKNAASRALMIFMINVLIEIEETRLRPAYGFP
jgi:hypothetical protein